MRPWSLGTVDASPFWKPQQDETLAHSFPPPPSPPALPPQDYMSAAPSNALIDVLSVAFTNNDGLTEASSRNELLDLFYGLKDHLGRKAAQELTLAAWKVSPLDTLKLVFYALDVREGKSINLVALYALQALWPAHPKTVLAALQHVPQFGC